MRGHILPSLACLLGAALFLAATSPVTPSQLTDGPTIFARIHDSSGTPAFDILETVEDTLFSTQGVGSAVVEIGFIARPLAAHPPGRTQQADIIGIHYNEPDDIETVLSSTTLPWDEYVRASFNTADLHAFDELRIRHVIEGGSRTTLMTVAAPSLTPSGAFTQPDQTAEICVITQKNLADDAPPCILKVTHPNGDVVTYKIKNNPNSEAGEVPSANINIANVSTWAPSNECKSSGKCGED